MTDVKIKYPINKIKRDLYNHQLISIKNMEELENRKEIQISETEIIKTRFGILADIAGYGKTMSMLGLICKNNKWDDDSVYIHNLHNGTDFLSRNRYEYFEKVNCSLIILNSIILSQWEKELKYTELKFKKVASRKDVDIITIEEGTDLILCDSQFYPLVLGKFSKSYFKRIVVDEPININKLSMDIKFNCDFLWFITATPYQVYMKNRYPHIINIDDTTFSKIFIKNPDEFVKMSFKMPPIQMFSYKCTSILYNVLKGKVRSTLEELLISDSITSIIEALGGKKGDSQSIINMVFERKKKKINELDILIKARGDNSEKLIERKANLEKELIDLNIKFQKILEENSCPICLERFKDPCITTCCQNIFCSSCITSCLKNLTGTMKCPLCRFEISTKNLICITNNPQNKQEKKSLQKYMTKQQCIVDIINTYKKGKFIIYSNYSESFESIKKYLEEMKIQYTELKGMKSQKEKHLEKYKSGDIDVLLLTTLQYSAGIELINTTDIILYHNMPEPVQTQIIGRANRLGRTIPLRTHTLY